MRFVVSAWLNGSVEKNRLVYDQAAFYVDVDGIGIHPRNHFHVSVCYGILFGPPDE